ncbi:MAG TPA: potassium-transporting ATPase subunit KdpA, partial [Cytophagaceae bacterium]|nr:potassium-transporting ATPase subunit KdpA [Cytophagaceae bacterium]
MLYTELIGILFVFFASFLLAIPLGKYIARVYQGEKTILDPVFNPLEKIFFNVSGINSNASMNWKQHLSAMLTINFVWFLLAIMILMNQAWLPFNPDGNPNMSADLAFNTSISFLVNCNLQHYSGESGVSYFSQIFALMFLQFVSAATGMAAAAVLFNAMKEKMSDRLGNFYDYFIKSATRILLPLCILVSILLLFRGTPMTIEGKDTMISMEGDTVQVSRGPAAAFIAIKHLGTNGGGFFGVNSAHPFENPDYFTNMVEVIAQTIIPFAMIFALGFYLKRKKLVWMIFGVMTLGFVLLVVPTVLTDV